MKLHERMDAIFESGTPPNARLVLIALASHADPIGACRPSIALIASKTGLGDGKTINLIDAMGVLLSAVKALDAEVRQLKAEVRHG